MPAQDPQRQIPLVASTSEGDIAGSEQLVNVFPEKSTGGKYPFTLKGTPGQAFFLELPTFPVKGIHFNKGRAFAVTPSKLYEIFANGTYVELGDVDFIGRVVMEDNGIQIVMVDGFKGYSWDAQTNIVSQLTGDGWYPAKTVTYQDGYFIFERKDTGQFFISDLLSVNFDPLDAATAEGQPDKLVAVLSDHREVFMFGTETIEVWYNSGAADFPFERNQGAFVEKGCAAPYSIAKKNNTIYFIGSDLMVYQMVGYTPVRISSHAVEEDLKDIELSDAFAYTYAEGGHLFYMMTLPARNKTWCFDISTGAWHLRRDYQFGRHRSNCHAFFDNKNLVGDFQSGRIYQLTQKYFSDDNEPLVREFILPTINNGREFLTMYSFELDMSSGIGLTYGQGSDPQAILNFSKDSGKTWSNDKFTSLGKIGEYLERVKWNRLGAARQFVIRIRISDPVPIDIGGAWVEIR
tara:strand:- start:3011 stop:4396 length:1386 start_codon:yes stop_codon:yes gene_type:complete